MYLVRPARSDTTQRTRTGFEPKLIVLLVARETREQTYGSYGQGKTRATLRLIQTRQSEQQARKTEFASRFCNNQEATSSIRTANVVPGIVSRLVQAESTKSESESSHVIKIRQTCRSTGQQHTSQMTEYIMPQTNIDGQRMH